MTINDGSADDSRHAMRQFDESLRDSDEWVGWEGKKNNKFAFVDNGRRYPMKEIISLATGTAWPRASATPGN